MSARARFAARLIGRAGSAWHRVDRRRSTASRIVTRCGLAVHEGAWQIALMGSAIDCGWCRARGAR